MTAKSIRDIIIFMRTLSEMVSFDFTKKIRKVLDRENGNECKSRNYQIGFVIPKCPYVNRFLALFRANSTFF